MSTINEYEMNINIIYDNFDSIIENINATFKCDNIEKEKEMKKNIASFWKWTPLTNIVSILDSLKTKIKICSNKDSNQKFKETFIIQNNNISCNEFFNNLNEILDEFGEYYHPFIIFLTKESIHIDYNEYYNLDNKKIFFLPFPEDESLLVKLIFKLIQCCSYYNELGDYFEVNGYPYQAISDI